MRVTLYRYNGKSNVANKLKDLTPVFDEEITPYGAFSSTNVTFKLDRLMDVNFCRYGYNNHNYYGTVTVDVDTNGAYVYNIQIDALATAYYNDCMNTNAVCMYSSQGSSLIYDARVASYDSIQRMYHKIANEIPEKYYVVMTVKNNLPLAGTYEMYNPSFDVYLFIPIQFYFFMSILKEIGSANEAKFIPSIMNFYLIPEDEVNINAFTAELSSPVYLYPVLGSSNDTLNVNPYHVEDNNLNYIARLMERHNQHSAMSYLKKTQTTINYPITSTRQNSIFQLHVRDTGDFVFKYSDVVNSEDILTVGYGIAFDFITGKKTAFLDINGEILIDYRLDVNIPLTFPMSYDSSITRWDTLNASIAGSILAVGGTAAAIAAGAVTGGAAFLAAAGSAVGIYAAAENFRYNENYGSRSVIGGVGGSTELMANTGSVLIIKERQQIGLSAFQTLYGKPDYNSRYLRNVAAGYVQTIKCKLLKNGLDTSIIAEAEKQCDSGFYLI